MYLEISRSTGWAGHSTTFLFSKSGSGTVATSINCTYGTLSPILVPSSYEDMIHLKSAMKNIFFNKPFDTNYQITTHNISNSLLSELKTGNNLLALNYQKCSVLFSKNKLALVNCNSVLGYKNIANLDLSSSEKFCKSINRMIQIHLIKDLDSLSNHYQNRNVLLTNNFENLDAVYNEILKREYYV